MRNTITQFFFTLLLGSTLNAQISTGAGGASIVLPNSSTTNTNVGMDMQTKTGEKVKLHFYN
jgi:hypothetical protein